jgi:hypothetical protein
MKITSGDRNTSGWNPLWKANWDVKGWGQLQPFVSMIWQLLEHYANEQKKLELFQKTAKRGAEGSVEGRGLQF